MLEGYSWGAAILPVVPRTPSISTMELNPGRGSVRQLPGLVPSWRLEGPFYPACPDMRPAEHAWYTRLASGGSQGAAMMTGEL